MGIIASKVTEKGLHCAQNVIQYDGLSLHVINPVWQKKADSAEAKPQKAIAMKLDDFWAIST